jgi:hypothetical protein
MVTNVLKMCIAFVFSHENKIIKFTIMTTPHKRAEKHEIVQQGMAVSKRRNTNGMPHHELSFLLEDYVNMQPHKTLK